VFASPQSHPAKAKRTYKCSNCKDPNHRASRCPDKALPHVTPLLPSRQPPPSQLFATALVRSPSRDLEPNFGKSNASIKSPEEDLLELSLLEDLGTISVERLGSDSDEDNVCLWCEEPLPSAPSKRLEKLKATLCALPNAMSLPFPQTASFCNLHQAERDVIPLGKLEGWPLQIDFDLLKK
ncbi:hypothetical protein DFH28DRAFT_880972, partial [Melampsora americana]